MSKRKINVVKLTLSKALHPLYSKKQNLAMPLKVLPG
jgi:hypothetical protein